jgi:hypothetical protein
MVSLDKGIGYQGLLYKIYSDLEAFTNKYQPQIKLFLQVLMLYCSSENGIFSTFIASRKALVYWDTDYTILQDPFS